MGGTYPVEEHVTTCFRLLMCGGRTIKPYGLDCFLRRFGFPNAKTTIPMGIQQGFMDPVDKLLAVLMLRMTTLEREERPAGEGDYNRRQTDRK
jgi:hypothetical protein